MKELKITTRFKKDLKRVQNSPKKINELNTVLEFLRESGTVPQKYNPHSLTGNYKGFWECHIEGDFLLIWIEENSDVIKLVRLGGHSELF